MKKVVLDPGHGGIDSGAANLALNLKESDINLSIVKKALTFGGSDSSLLLGVTRPEDEYLALQDRCKLANETKADLFVSVHCNSCGSPEVRGFEAYHFYGSYVGSILARSLSDEVMAILNSITEGCAIFRGIKEAGFCVLQHTNMPAVLLELGFISNDEEAMLLASSQNQEEIAKAIIMGIKDFFDMGFVV